MADHLIFQELKSINSLWRNIYQVLLHIQQAAEKQASDLRVQKVNNVS
jgi:hypothetical protein